MLHSLAQYPHWFVVVCAVFAGAVALWILLKLLKAALWILVVGLAVLAVCAAAGMLFG